MRFAGSMWDFYFLENSKFNEKKVGLNIDRKSDKIKIDFASALALTTVDKKEFQSIMEGALAITSMMENSAQTPKSVGDWIMLVDKLMLRADLLRPSLVSRFKTLVSNYDNILDVSRNGSQSDVANRFVNLTASGAELMHIAAAAAVLSEALNKTSERIDAQNLTGLSNYVQTLKVQSQKIREQFMQPLIEFYKKIYAKNNQKIISKRVTDWTTQYYSDAIFANKVYEFLK